MEQETPSSEQETLSLEHETPSSEQETLSLEHETPSSEHETPSSEHETPSLEHETPSLEQETPSSEHEISVFKLSITRSDRILSSAIASSPLYSFKLLSNLSCNAPIYNPEEEFNRLIF
ncbi:MAG: hypothetical protein KME32_29365 [Mojavia pulchra JT2-VF2]|uniref:Uncharacterized protein n=1 Tax=Mojavia pulchra JT2-VF2 TaxID=287848 RepID=A0A951Q388_9NOST|nr:hypothetical protein [Mojavia pulchra JT2-VF2]